MLRTLSAALAAVFIMAAAAQAQPGACTGQLVYVPVYSHIYIGDKERPYMLAITLSIRNISPKTPITVTAVDYYDTEGKKIKAYLDKPVAVEALRSQRYVIGESDKSGGSGAKFLIRWESGSSVVPPLIEAIMIGSSGQQGISFTSRGVPVEVR